MKKRFSAAGAIALAVLGLISTTAHAAVFNYSVTLNGASEFPTNASNGSGTGTVAYDDVAGTLALQVTYSGLTGTVTQTHFHAATGNSGVGSNATASAAGNVGIAIGNTSLPLFALGATSGSYSNTLNLNDSSIYGGAYLTNNGGTAAGARAAFVAALNAGKTYWNIHSSSFTGGEIRGFPTPVQVPEPATAGLLAVSLAAVILRHRRK